MGNQTGFPLFRDVRLSGQSGSRVDRTPLLFLTDTAEKVFWGRRTKFTRTAAAFPA
jgi:hypothetical protein